MSTAFHAGHIIHVLFSCIFMKLCVNTPALNWSIWWRYTLWLFNFFLQDLQMDYEQGSPKGSIMGGNK